MSKHIAQLVGEFPLGDVRVALVKAPRRVKVVNRMTKQEKVAVKVAIMHLRGLPEIQPQFAEFGKGEGTVEFYHKVDADNQRAVELMNKIHQMKG